MSDPTLQRDPADRVRQLLLSGDNIIKNRESDDRFVRARARYEQALALARDVPLEDNVIAIIERRLDGLPPDPGNAAAG